MISTLARGIFASRVSRGFTLIELMIVVVVIGILAAIAYPNYMEYVRSAARADAKAILQETAQFMERYYTTNGTYIDAPLLSNVSPKGAGGRYTIAYSVGPTISAYKLEATPIGAQSADRCGTLTLTQTGATEATTSGCW